MDKEPEEYLLLLQNNFKDLLVRLYASQPDDFWKIYSPLYRWRVMLHGIVGLSQLMNLKLEQGKTISEEDKKLLTSVTSELIEFEHYVQGSLAFGKDLPLHE